MNSCYPEVRTIVLSDASLNWYLLRVENAGYHIMDIAVSWDKTSLQTSRSEAEI